MPPKKPPTKPRKKAAPAKAKPKAGPDVATKLKRAYDGRFDDVSAAVLVVVPPRGRIVSVNVEAEELTGYERSELEGLTLGDIFREEDRTRIESIFDQSAELEFRKLFEHNVIVRKRSQRKVLVDMGFRRTTFAGDNAFVFTLQDITDLKANEERVIRAHEYVNNIINSIIEILLVTNSTGEIQTVNAAALALLGYQEQDVLGQPVKRLLPDLDGKDGETHVLTRDGRKVPVLLTQSVLRTGGRQADGSKTVIVAMDISERKKNERLIAEQQMMIVQSSKMSSLGEMASSIAHEINNPLQVILGRCELLDLQTTSPTPNLTEVRASVELIDRMSQRIHKIVRGLQALARDQRHDAMEEVDVADIIRDTLALCEQRIRIGVSKLTLPELKHPVLLRCRPTQISQVLLNLLNNSCDEVTGKPGAWISVELRELDGQLELAVTDSGHGIPVEVAEKLFTPFFTTKPVGKGTGIGLSVSKSLIESHGGVLELDRGSKNTRFVIRLPSAGQAKKAG